MSLIVASQMDGVFNAGLSAHPIGPRVIGVPEERPWEAANDADILVVRPSAAWRSHHGIARPASWPGRLRWVYSASAGIDFYPPWLLDAPIVSCGRGVAAEEIADYVIAAIYHRAKPLTGLQVHRPEDWASVPLGRIAGTTLGIVGFGAIGSALARKAVALGLDVVATRRRALPAGVAGVRMAGIAEVIAAADHIVLALPATPQTRNLIDAALLATARPGAHLINVARGSVLDQDALLASLDDGPLGFATLDVTEPEPLPAHHRLWTHPQVRLTPHVSSNHSRVRHLLLKKVAADLDRFARGERPGDIVDRAAGY